LDQIFIIRTYLKVHLRIGEIKKLLIGEELFGFLNVVPLCVLILILLKIPQGDRRMDVWTVAELFPRLHRKSFVRRGLKGEGELENWRRLIPLHIKTQ
jgi:hypothetical protein